MNIEISNLKILKFILNSPTKNCEWQKIVGDLREIKGEKVYHIEKFSAKQAFQQNLQVAEIENFLAHLFEVEFLQMELWTNEFIYSYRAAKKRILTNRRPNRDKLAVAKGQDKVKQYILREGIAIEPLVELGIFDKNYRIVKKSFDKYRQINRFLEFIEDSTKNYLENDEITVIDFGCGKSYLTFVVYYYFSVIRKLKAKIIGLDLKVEVIEECNCLAEKFNYTNLHFEIGDISKFECNEKVDMVITLHACDTATDYALYNAIKWQSEIILSVPCCQHELNSQFKSDSLSVLNDYGIIRERLSALLTDTIRAKLLEAMGYKTQVLEFVDLSHTPKNLLIRAVKSQKEEKNRENIFLELEKLQKEFNLSQKLYELLKRN